MRGAGFTRVAGAVMGVLCVGLLHAAGDQGSPDRLRLQQPVQARSDASDQARWRAATPDNGRTVSGEQAVEGDARHESAAGAAAPDPKLEQTRLRLEQHLKEQREMTGNFDAEPASRRPDTRFGVGYEFRMRGRQELGFDSPGGGAGGAEIPGTGSGGALGGGFGGGRR